MMEYLLPILAAGSVFILINVLFGGNSDTKRIKKRISSLNGNKTFEQIHDEVIREKRSKVNKTSKSLISKGFEADLLQSGIKLSAKEYLTAWLLLTFVPGLLLLLLGVSMVTIFGVVIVGFIVPPLLVQRAKKKRELLFNRQLSQTLVLLGNSIKSGYSFQQGIEHVATEMQPPISNEFGFVIKELQYGVKMEDALNHMVDRTRNPDLAILVSAVVTSSQVGANLSDILDNISATIRDRLQIKDDIRILTAQGRMSGMIIGLLPVFIALIFMLMNPDYMLSFFDSTLGKILLAIGVVMEILGFLVVRKMVDLKY